MQTCVPTTDHSVSSVWIEIHESIHFWGHTGWFDIIFIRHELIDNWNDLIYETKWMNSLPSIQQLNLFTRVKYSTQMRAYLRVSTELLGEARH